MPTPLMVVETPRPSRVSGIVSFAHKRSRDRQLGRRDPNSESRRNPRPILMIFEKRLWTDPDVRIPSKSLGFFGIPLDQRDLIGPLHPPSLAQCAFRRAFVAHFGHLPPAPLCYRRHHHCCPMLLFAAPGAFPVDLCRRPQWHFWCCYYCWLCCCYCLSLLLLLLLCRHPPKVTGDASTAAVGPKSLCPGVPLKLCKNEITQGQQWHFENRTSSSPAASPYRFPQKNLKNQNLENFFKNILEIFYKFQ